MELMIFKVDIYLLLASVDTHCPCGCQWGWQSSCDLCLAPVTLQCHLTRFWHQHLHPGNTYGQPESSSPRKTHWLNYFYSITTATIRCKRKHCMNMRTWWRKYCTIISCPSTAASMNGVKSRKGSLKLSRTEHLYCHSQTVVFNCFKTRKTIGQVSLVNTTYCNQVHK